MAYQQICTDQSTQHPFAVPTTPHHPAQLSSPISPYVQYTYPPQNYALYPSIPGI
ncbi:hypothetical protein NEOLEDRAFT_1138832 [Neolentinus lepideus HHB14362 ss-1]|uniref:Uncharacterized protein n=1 Tax=Neolentinus lepideus HHB14362 ss-1 TaxID=1314782 RepID=A0A165Q2P8_9AGAM|nr:hypothetical protein NEOLEDRAFT_1138832 [Neolentinus lepideus HHB14362 ss-1]